MEYGVGCLGEKNVLFEPFIYKNASFYQDRLGTNIRKAPKKVRFS